MLGPSDSDWTFVYRINHARRGSAFGSKTGFSDALALLDRAK